MRIASGYRKDARVVLYTGDCLKLLATMPDGCAKLVVTSPPYNLSKATCEQDELDSSPRYSRIRSGGRQRWECQPW